MSGEAGMAVSTYATTDIYDGLDFIGQVVERDKGRQFEAFSVTGQAIGVFPSPTKAARAVHEAAHNQQREVAS